MIEIGSIVTLSEEKLSSLRDYEKRLFAGKLTVVEFRELDKESVDYFARHYPNDKWVRVRNDQGFSFSLMSNQSKS